MSSSAGKLDKMADYLEGNLETASTTAFGKRVTAFKGKHILAALRKKNDKYEDDKVATKLITELLLTKKYFHKAIKNPDKTEARSKLIAARGPDSLTFDVKGRYIWIYEGNPFWRNLYLGIIIGGFFGCCLFPIWPRFVKVGVWYVAVTFLLFMLALIAVRLVVFGFCWLVGYDVWILPNLFDDEATVYDSFQPLYTAQPAGGQWMGRVGVFIFLVAAGYWVYQQPTEFDGYVEAQKDFLSDLYSGNLLNDKSQEDMDNIDKVIPLEELLRQEQEAEAAAAAEAESEESFMDKLINEVVAEDELEDQLADLAEEENMGA